MSFVVSTPEQMRAIGGSLADVLEPGDLVVLTGDLGAGKTVLTQGIGLGLGVRGKVLSPTFVIARVHPAKLPLVHVDAYRIGSLAEIDDLDLDASLEESVTVVEWGEGLVEGLADARLAVHIARSIDTEHRVVTWTPYGDRWLRRAAALEDIANRSTSLFPC